VSEGIKALVVEDDPKIRDEIEDVLVSLGHVHDWAESQQDARTLIEKHEYHYVLVDLEIPARTGRGFAKIEYGRQFVDLIQQVKGRGRVPVIIMTGHHRDGFNLTMDLLGNGAMGFISKPFGDAASGKSLSQVVQDVLKKHRNAFPPGTLPADPPKEFKGGTLAFFPTHIELNAEPIVEPDGVGHAWDVMQALRTRRPDGRLPYFSAPKLAKAVDPAGQLTEGAIASCIHDLRVKIINIMLEKANVVVGREAIITNNGRGYRLASWLTIEVHDCDTKATPAAEPARGTNVAVAPADSAPARAAERREWILAQLRGSEKLTRQMVQKRFGIGDKQAKRELGGLTESGMIEFRRKPPPGYYALRQKASRAGRNS
jgi:DNA-binding response OmpR family regulator